MHPFYANVFFYFFSISILKFIDVNANVFFYFISISMLKFTDSDYVYYDINKLQNKMLKKRI